MWKLSSHPLHNLVSFGHLYYSHSLSCFLTTYCWRIIASLSLIAEIWSHCIVFSFVAYFLLSVTMELFENCLAELNYLYFLCCLSLVFVAAFCCCLSYLELSFFLPVMYFIACILFVASINLFNVYYCRRSRCSLWLWDLLLYRHIL